MSPKFEALTRNVKFHSNVNNPKSLDFYYNVFKKKNLKKLILAEIKENLL